ncbi:hypothetical protein [Armatimonas rosea]|uniref:Uncharacterized protein n=1 Tax=Armatimonas rosea TaxID=685828 RepID=A0A7W9SR98_ARMRO|nr:hypothetical protein [Armatimonas rosea]MBB6050754.1 hypothetical protein [Armatimonas rosea]
MAEDMGFWETFFMGFETKRVEKQSEFEVRQIKANQRVVEAHQRKEAAEHQRLMALRRQELDEMNHAIECQRNEWKRMLVKIEGQKQLLIAGCEFLDWQHETQVRQTVYSLPPDQAVAYIEQMREVERGLLEHERIRQTRLKRPLEGTAPRQIQGSPPASAPTPAPNGWADEDTFTPVSAQSFPSKGQSHPENTMSNALTEEQIQKLAKKAVDRFDTLPKERQKQAWRDWEEGLKERFPKLVVEEILTEAVAMRKRT